MVIEMEMEIIKKSRKLAIEVYKLVRCLPKEEQYGLRSQITRSAVSVGSNIVEGNQRKGKDRIHLFNIARGSCAEVEFQASIIAELYDQDISEILLLCMEIMKMSHGLIKIS